MIHPTLMNTYGDRAITLQKGEGVWLWDNQGRRYLDALSGIAVCGIGHAHPEVATAIAEQAATLTHCSNLFNIPGQQQLADKLTSATGMDKVFFCNSGAEANEAAIKLARRFGNNKGIELPTVIVAEGSFHGRTLATLSATGNRKVQAGFEPLVQGFSRAPYGDLASIEKIGANNRNICAVLVEPIQGEGGVVVPPAGYLKGLRELCDKNGWLLMLDEIQTGIGRTGSLFHFMQHNIKPDVVTSAKGLGNGFPIGACLARGAAAELFQPGNHGTTFGGNPMACAAGLATLNVIERDHLCARAKVLGELFQSEFSAALTGVDAVKDIRGCGLMIGIELDRPLTDMVARCAAAGVIANVTAGNVIRLLPAMVMTDEQARQVVAIVSEQIKAFLAQPNS